MARQLSLGIGGCLRKILLAGLAVAAIIACDRQKPGEEAGIIRIDIDGRSSGTGFAINQAGHVVTSFQVIAGAGNDPGKIAVIETAPDDGARHKVDRIEWSSAPLDLAVLHVAGLRQPAALLQEREPEPNDTVFAIGLGSLGASGESGDRLSGPVAREGTVRRVTADNRYRSPGAAAGGVQPPSGNTPRSALSSTPRRTIRAAAAGRW